MGDLYAAACRYAEQGVSTVPIGGDSGKKPLVKWEARQRNIPSEKTLRSDYRRQSVTGIGGVTGEVSGRLALIEFEAVAMSEVLDDFRGKLEDELPRLWARMEDGWSQNSPSGGLHLLIRVEGSGPLGGNRKLAQRYPTEAEQEATRLVGVKIGLVTLIETREEGGFVGLAPGRSRDGEWKVRHGGPDTAAVLTDNELATIVEIAAKFNEVKPTELSTADRAPNPADIGTRPGDVFNATATWEDVLIHRRSPENRAFYAGEQDSIGHFVRPGKSESEGHSATVNALGTDRLIVFSSNWPPFDSEQHADEAGRLRRRSYSRFEAEALLGHSGDLSACARALAEDGFGVDRLENLRADIPAASTPTQALDACIAVFRSWLLYPEPGPLRVVAAVVNAGEQEGDPPLGLFLVGPPSSGKTETVGALNRYLGAQIVSTISSEGALLSGTSAKERSKNATGGLLRQIGDRGVIIIKDFTTILSMHRDTRQTLLAAIREIMDGQWTRNLGTDGGLTLEWEGNVTIIAAVTPALDQHRNAISTMGERLLTYRMPEPPAIDQAMMALNERRDAQLPRMRAELRSAMMHVLELASTQPTPEVDYSVKHFIGELAVWGVRMRSPVWRDYTVGYEIGERPQPEQPPRLAIALRQVYTGLIRIGATEPEAENDVLKVVRDSIPPTRLALFDCLAAESAPVKTSVVGLELDVSTKTVLRWLEDATALNIAVRTGTENRGYEWELSKWGRDFKRFAT